MPLAAMKSAEGAFDAASDRFDTTERALDAAREERAQAWRVQVCGSASVRVASVTADRLIRVREVSECLDRRPLALGVPGSAMAWHRRVPLAHACARSVWMAQVVPPGAASSLHRVRVSSGGDTPPQAP
jgi:hypothetical protein